MTREETIKWLESLKAEIGKSEHRTLWHYAEAIDMAIEALKAEAVSHSEQYKKGFEDAKRAYLVEYARESGNMRKQNAQLGGWILCSERLPKNGDWAIVTILDEYGDTPYRYTDFGWYLEVANCWIIDAQDRTDVTAWMPLPESYKGGDIE